MMQNASPPKIGFSPDVRVPACPHEKLHGQVDVTFLPDYPAPEALRKVRCSWLRGGIWPEK